MGEKMTMKTWLLVAAHKYAFSQFPVEWDNEINWVDMSIQSSEVKKKQAGDMRRKTRAQESTPQSSGIDDSPECLRTV